MRYSQNCQLQSLSILFASVQSSLHNSVVDKMLFRVFCPSEEELVLFIQVVVIFDLLSAHMQALAWVCPTHTDHFLPMV